MEDKIVCASCGGSNIQKLAWVDGNTHEYESEYKADFLQTQWCRDCGDFADWTMLSEWKEKEEEDDSDN